MMFFRSSDGSTLLISSSDGFCSTLSFTPGELGQEYKGELASSKNNSVAGTAASNQATPIPTPTSVFAPPSPFPNHQHRNSGTSFTAPSPPPTTSFVNARPPSPTRSNSTSSVATQASVINNPPLIGGSVPSITATNSGKVTGVPMTTPPETPGSANIAAGAKREATEGEKEDTNTQPKKRRIAPTPVLPAEPKP